MSDADERLAEADRSIAAAKRRDRKAEADLLVPPRPPASPRTPRFAAAFCDALIVEALVVAGSSALHEIDRHVNWTAAMTRGRGTNVSAAMQSLRLYTLAETAVAATMIVCCFAALAVVTGGSPGKRLVGLRVAVLDGGASSGSRLALREVLRWGVFLFCGLGRDLARVADQWPALRSIGWGLFMLTYAHVGSILWACHHRQRTWYDVIASTIVEEPGNPNDRLRGFTVMTHEADGVEKG